MLENDGIKIFGHRGAAGLAFENTLKSIEKAMDEGVYGIEIDVWKTADDEIVVFHDAYLERLGERKGLITNLTRNILKTIRLKSGDKIPRLIDVIDLIQNKGVILLVEIKSENTFKPALHLLKTHFNYSQFIIGSFFHEVIKQCKEVNPHVQTAIMFEGVPFSLDKYLQEVNPDYVVTSIETYNQHLIRTIKSQQRKLLFYGVNTSPEINLAVAEEPFGIITNFPNLFKK